METATATAPATVVNRNNDAEGVNIKRAKDSANVMSTRPWTDKNGVEHPAAPTQAKQPVSIRYTAIEKSDGTEVELITVRFKKSGVAIRGFSSDFAHLLVPVKKGSEIGHIVATEMSYDARTQHFSTDEVEVSEDEDDNEASA